MRILIDARMYGPKIAKGLGRYIQQIIKGLKQQDLENEYVVLLTKDNWDEFEETERFKKILAPWRWYTLAEQIYLPGLIKKQKPDLVHFPHFNAPIFYRGPFVLTIHDLLLRRYSSRRASTLGIFKYWFKNLSYRVVVYLAIKRAKKIIAVSNFTKKEILKYYKINPNKVEIVYEGVTRVDAKNRKNSDDKGALLRYNITEPFLLYVGNAFPHKNLEKLLEAFKLKEGSEQLVLVGKKDYFYYRLEDYADKLGLNTNSVLFLGYVPDEDLASLYYSASLYVFPSLYEGFGLPPLEAMSCGLPVAASNAEGIREICGSACEYFDPENIKDIIAKIKFVLANSNQRDNLRKSGFEQIKKYNWEEAAKRHLEIYLQI